MQFNTPGTLHCGKVSLNRDRLHTRTRRSWRSRFKQVEQFKYLGSIFVREGGCKEDVKTRCLKAAQVFYQLSPRLGHKEISLTAKTQIIKAAFTPTLLYQSENWTVTSKERQMLTTTEMRCLRKAAGKTRMDKIRNEEIRRRVNMQPAEQTANKNKIRWWSHVKRMAPTAPQSKALVIQPEGRRPRRRTRNRWEDDRRKQLGQGETSDCLSTRRRLQKSSTTKVK